MTNDKDSKKVGKIGSATKAKGVERAKEIEKAESVKGAEGVGSVLGVGGVGGTGAAKPLSLDQRERLMNLVAEEAAKLAAAGIIPKSQKAIVENAVKMVIDAAMVDEPKKK